MNPSAWASLNQFAWVSLNLSDAPGPVSVGIPASVSACHLVDDRRGNWRSEVSPTLGCSIKILRDIYIYYSYVGQSVSMSVVSKNA